MGQSFYQQTQMLFKAFDTRVAVAEQKVATIFQVLQEIIGKELQRGQALHKVLMDKGIFTDAELSAALKALIDEAKADLEKAKQEVAEEKQKAVEILIPAGANVAPPVTPETKALAPEVPPVSSDVQLPPTEGTNAEPPASNG